MLTELQVEIISKAAQIILQSRLEVKKALFAHFQNYFTKIKENNVKLSNLSIIEFLNQLLLKDFYAIKQKMGIKHHSIKPNQSIKIQIIFYLNDRISGNKLQVESWIIEVDRKKDINSSSLTLVVQFFKEIIFILNKLPLFSIYQKEKELKAKYILDYKIQSQKIKDHTLIDLKAKDIILRQNEAIRIKAEISFLPSFKYLINKQAIIQQSKRKTSVAVSEHDGDRKVSVYSFYDPDLDFTFLASDDQDFTKKGNSESIQIRMEIDNTQVSQQFQLLIADEEQDFLDQNKQILQLLIRQQKQYLYQ